MKIDQTKIVYKMTGKNLLGLMLMLKYLSIFRKRF